MNKDNRSPAQVMADHLPPTVRLAQYPDFHYTVDPGPIEYAAPYETMELRSIDVIHAFLHLQREALEEAKKRKKLLAFNKIKNMVTFDSRKHRL